MNIDWAGMRRILCVRLDNMGDVLMTSPALVALSAIHKETHITLLTTSQGATIAEQLDSIDEVIVADIPWTKIEHQNTDAEEVLSIIHNLRQKDFDMAIIFTVFSQNPLPAALICYLAEIPVRLGYCRENPYNLLTHWVPDEEPFVPLKHEVDRQCDLLELAGVSIPKPRRLVVEVKPQDQIYTHNLLYKHGLDLTRKWLVVHAGASEKRRQYPVEKYVELVTQLRREDFQVVLTGTKNEQELIDEIVAHEPACISLGGKLSLGQLIALIQRAPLLISNNTGPVHIAAATDTAVVVLYALTNPQHTPYGVPHVTLYFDVPSEGRSSNQLLQYIYPRMRALLEDEMSTDRIMEVVRELYPLNVT